MPEQLADLLRQKRVEALLSQVEIVRRWPGIDDRVDHAQQLVREAMYLRCLGTITQAEESRVFSLLSFVMPTDACNPDDPLPDPFEFP